MKPRIEELFCFAIVGEDGIEGVPAIQNGSVVMPLMGADMERMGSLKDAAREVEAQNPGKKVRLYKFTQKEEILWNESTN